MARHQPRPLRDRASVSVVIPCYNYAHFLTESVASVLDQSGLDLEVLIVDDASGDDSLRVAQELARDEARVEVLAHDTNAGHIATYNDGLARVRGDFVVLLSADDLVTPDSLTRAVALMQHHPRVGLVYGHAVAFDGLPPKVDTDARSWTTWSGRTWLQLTLRRSRNPVYTPSVVMRRTAWEQVGPYDARVPHAADMHLWFRAASAWDVGRVNNEAQAFYRVHGANMHMTTFAGMQRDIQEQAEVCRLLEDEPVPGHPVDPSLLRSARRAMARRASRLAQAERRTTRDEATARSFLDLAAQIAPDLRDAPVDRVRASAGTLVERRELALVRRAEDHLRWRIWRRWGL